MISLIFYTSPWGRYTAPPFYRGLDSAQAAGLCSHLRFTTTYWCCSLRGAEETKPMRCGQVPEAAGPFQVLALTPPILSVPTPGCKANRKRGCQPPNSTRHTSDHCVPRISSQASHGQVPVMSMQDQTDEWKPRMIRLPVLLTPNSMRPCSLPLSTFCGGKQRGNAEGEMQSPSLALGTRLRAFAGVPRRLLQPLQEGTFGSFLFRFSQARDRTAPFRAVIILYF